MLEAFGIPHALISLRHVLNSSCPGSIELITLATKDAEETLRDAQSCAPSRFENFLRDGGQHRFVYCGKGLDVVPAIFKANLKTLVPGIEPRTSRFEVLRTQIPLPQRGVVKESWIDSDFDFEPRGPGFDPREECSCRGSFS